MMDTRARALSIHPLAGRRARAYLLDAIGYLGIAAAMVPAGLLLNAYAPPTPGAVIAMSAVPPVVATIWASKAESGPSHATWGKRRLGLTVAAGNPLTFARALARNTVKIGIPWQLGHVVAVGAAAGGFEAGDPLTLATGVLIYPVIGVLTLMTALGRGLGPHDRASGTCVVETQPSHATMQDSSR